MDGRPDYSALERSRLYAGLHGAGSGLLHGAPPPPHFPDLGTGRSPGPDPLAAAAAAAHYQARFMSPGHPSLPQLSSRSSYELMGHYLGSATSDHYKAMLPLHPFWPPTHLSAQEALLASSYAHAYNSMGLLDASLPPAAMALDPRHSLPAPITPVSTTVKTETSPSSTSSSSDRRRVTTPGARVKTEGERREKEADDNIVPYKKHRRAEISPKSTNSDHRQQEHVDIKDKKSSRSHPTNIIPSSSSVPCNGDNARVESSTMKSPPPARPPRRFEAEEALCLSTKSPRDNSPVKIMKSPDSTTSSNHRRDSYKYETTDPSPAKDRTSAFPVYPYSRAVTSGGEMVISGSGDPGVFAYTSAASPNIQDGRKIHAPMFMPEVATVLTQAKSSSTAHKVKTELSPGGGSGVTSVAGVTGVATLKPKTEDVTHSPPQQRHGIKAQDEHHETGKQVAKHRLPLSPPGPLITQLGPVHGVKLSPSDQAINLTVASDRPGTQHLAGDLPCRTSASALPVISQSSVSSLTAQAGPWHAWEGLRRREYPGGDSVEDLSVNQSSSSSATLTDVKQEGERAPETVPFDLSVPAPAASRISSKDDSPSGVNIPIGIAIARKRGGESCQLSTKGCSSGSSQTTSSAADEEFSGSSSSSSNSQQRRQPPSSAESCSSRERSRDSKAILPSSRTPSSQSLGSHDLAGPVDNLRTSESGVSWKTEDGSRSTPVAPVLPSLPGAWNSLNSLWLQQGALPLPQPVPATPVDPSHIPVNPPIGFKLVQDSITGQVYLIQDVTSVEGKRYWATGGLSSSGTPAASTPSSSSHSVAPLTQKQVAVAPQLKATVAPQPQAPRNETKQEPLDSVTPSLHSALPGRVPDYNSSSHALVPLSRVKTHVSPVPLQQAPLLASNGTSSSSQVTVKSSPGPIVSCGQIGSAPHSHMPPYLYDPSLLAGRVLPPQLPPPMTEDRGCSPIQFPDPEPVRVNSKSDSGTSTDDLRTITFVNSETSPPTPPPAIPAYDAGVQTSDVEDDLQQYRQSGLHPDQSNEGFLDNGTPILCKINDNECVEMPRAGSLSPPPPQLIKEGKARDSPAPTSDTAPSYPKPPRKDSLASFCDTIFSSAEMTEAIGVPSSSSKPDLSYLQPEISKASDGLELLSVLATHAQKEASKSAPVSLAQSPHPPASPSHHSSCRSDTPDINSNYNAPKAYMLEGFTPLEPPSRSRDRRTEDWLTSTDGLGSPFRDTFDFCNFPASGTLDKMETLELEMTMRLAELQRRYKQKQRELAKLQPRKDRDRDRHRRKPGRPKKRKSKRSESSCSGLDGKMVVMSCSSTASSSDSGAAPCNEVAVPIVVSGSKKKKRDQDSRDSRDEMMIKREKDLKDETSSSSHDQVSKPKTLVSHSSQEQSETKTKDSADSSVVKFKSHSLGSSSSSSKKHGDKVKVSSKKSAKKRLLSGLTDSCKKSSSPTHITPGKTKSSSKNKTPGSKSLKTGSIKKSKSKSKESKGLSAIKPKFQGNIDDDSDSELEDVSWLFDEDEINPPLSVLTGRSMSPVKQEREDDWASTPSSDMSSDSDDSSLGLSPKYSDLRVMKTSIATATSVALKTKKRKKSPDDTGLDDSEMDDNPVKKRKPGRPKKLDKDGNLCFTETVVTKKPKPPIVLPLSSSSSCPSPTAPVIPSSSLQTPTVKKKTKSESGSVNKNSSSKPQLPPKQTKFTEDQWNIRRSERIFLSETLQIDTKLPKDGAQLLKSQISPCLSTSSESSCLSDVKEDIDVEMSDPVVIEPKVAETKPVEFNDKPVVEQKTEGKNKPVVEQKIEGKSKAVAEPRIEGKSKPMVEQKIEGKSKPVVEQKTEGKSKPVVEQKTEGKSKPVVEQKIEGKSKPVVEQKIEGKSKPVVEQKIEGKSKAVSEQKIEGKSKPVVEQKLEGKSKPVMEQKIEGKSKAKDKLLSSTDGSAKLKKKSKNKSSSNKLGLSASTLSGTHPSFEALSEKNASPALKMSTTPAKVLAISDPCTPVSSCTSKPASAILGSPCPSAPGTASSTPITKPTTLPGLTSLSTPVSSTPKSAAAAALMSVKKPKIPFSDIYSDSDSSSDGDNMPLSSLVERPQTPEPRSCVINKEDLCDGLRVLFFMEGLFYESAVKAIQPPDVYGVVVDGERGSRPHIMSQEELLNNAVFDVKPGSQRFLTEGTRVCAYWSQQFSCLYPGTIIKGSPTPGEDPDMILVEFDDGDSGRIVLEHIRMLPPDYPVINIEPNPLIVMGGGRRRRTVSDDVMLEIKERRLSVSDFSSPVNEAKKKASNKAKKAKIEGEPKSSLPQIKEDVDTKDDKNEKPATTVFPAMDTKVEPKPDVSSAPVVSGGAENDTALSDVSTVSKDKEPGTPGSIKKKHKHKDKDKKSRKTSVDGEEKHKHHHKKHKDKEKKHKKHEEKKSKEVAAGSYQATFLNDANKSPTAMLITNRSSSTSATSPMDVCKKSELTVRIRANSEEYGKPGTSAEDMDVDVVGESSNSTIDIENEPVETKKPEEEQTDSQDISVTDLSEDEDQGTAEDEGKNGDKKTNTKSSKSPAKRRDRHPSVDKSKIAAFLPARQLWRWSGRGTKRPGLKGKAKKEYYKAISRGKELIRVGDCAVFLSTGRPHLPYVGRIESLWESWGGNMVVKVTWFYHPEETKGGKRLLEVKGALYQSPHTDENDVQTISHKCEVESYTIYKQCRQYNNNDLYYLAGTYDPTIGMITFEADVKIKES